MYLQLLNYVSYFLSLLFIAFLCWSLNWAMLKNLWYNARAKVIIKEKTAEALANGLKKFEFGSTVIYAKTTQGALYKYRKLKRETKVIQNQLKKA